MKKNPEIRLISSNVWSIEPNTTELPVIVVMAAPGRLSIRLDGIDTDEAGLESLEDSSLNSIVADEFIKLAHRLKELDFNKE